MKKRNILRHPLYFGNRKVSHCHARCLLTFFAFALGMLSPHASILTVWQNQSQGQAATNNVTVRIEGTRYRMDPSPGVSMLLDGEAGFGYQILHPSKCYVRKPLAELQSATPCANATNALPPFATGRSKVIAGHKAHEYRITNACGVGILWIAPDYPDWKRISDASATAVSKLAGRTSFQPSSDVLPGMVVRTETLTSYPAANHAKQTAPATLATNIATLLSATVVPDDPSLMQIPSDYREVASLDSVEQPKTNQYALELLNESKAQAQWMSSTNKIASLSTQFKYQQEQWSNAIPTAALTKNPSSSLATESSSAAANAAPAQDTNIYLKVSSWGNGRSQPTKIALTNGPALASVWSRLKSATNQSGRVNFNVVTGSGTAKPLPDETKPTVDASANAPGNAKK